MAPRRLPTLLLIGAVLLPAHVRAQAFADAVVAYQIGTGGGAGLDKMPGVVLGPPHGGGPFQGSTDTLSLGLGGWIILEFTDGWIVDKPGPDFTVFENPFLVIKHLGASLTDVRGRSEPLGSERTSPSFITSGPTERRLFS